VKLKATFFELAFKYSTNSSLIEQLWEEIQKNYSQDNRYYHTLTHLENLILQLSEVRDKVLSWDTVLFSVYYHDVIYQPTKANNEEKSADLAKKRLEQINVAQNTISKCVAMILATKSHLHAENNDTNYFTDADLSILGQDWDNYETYFKQIRKEYSVYPDFIYNPGRKKVLDHFLQMDRIYKTDYFYLEFESRARENLLREKNSINNLF